MNNVDVLKKLVKVSDLDTKVTELGTKVEALSSAFKIIAKVNSFSEISTWYSTNEKSPAQGDVFLVKVTENATENNTYDEYVYIGEAFENLGPVVAPVETTGEGTVTTLTLDVLDSAFSTSDDLYVATVTPSSEDENQFKNVKFASFVVDGQEELANIKVSDTEIVITLEAAKTGKLILLKDSATV